MMNTESLPTHMVSMEIPHECSGCDGNVSAKTELSLSELTQNGAAVVLSLSSLTDDQVSLKQICEKTSWKISEAYTCVDALVRLARERPDVVLCEANLPDCDWRDLLAVLSRRTNPPYLIVTSGVADDYMWAEVLNLGGHDLLVKPFDPVEIYQVVGSACQRHQQSNQGGAKS